MYKKEKSLNKWVLGDFIDHVMFQSFLPWVSANIVFQTQLTDRNFEKYFSEPYVIITSLFSFEFLPLP